MCLARVIRLIMASATLFATINAAPAPFGPVTTAIGNGPTFVTYPLGPPPTTALEPRPTVLMPPRGAVLTQVGHSPTLPTVLPGLIPPGAPLPPPIFLPLSSAPLPKSLVPHTTFATLPSGPLPTSRALQILPRDDPGHTPFTNLDLDEPFDYPGQFDACTPQQTYDIKNTIEDVHRLAMMSAYASEVDLNQHSVAHVKLFGAETATLSSEVAEMLLQRWFGASKNADAEFYGKAKGIRDVFLRVGHMLSNDTVPLRFNCKPDLDSCYANLDHGGVGVCIIDVIGTKPHIVNVCPEFWSGLSLEQILYRDEDFSGFDQLPEAYHMLYALMDPMLLDFESPWLSTDFGTCKDDSLIVPNHFGDNRPRHAQDIAENCKIAAGVSPDNWVAFAFEVAMATFKGHTQALQSDMSSLRERNDNMGCRPFPEQDCW